MNQKRKPQLKYLVPILIVGGLLIFRRSSRHKPSWNRRQSRGGQS